jgi:hypothetical protein
MTPGLAFTRPSTSPQLSEDDQMTISASIHRVKSAKAQTYPKAEHGDAPFGCCTFSDGDGNEVKLFTTPEAAHALAAAFNAAMQAAK